MKRIAVAALLCVLLPLALFADDDGKNFAVSGGAELSAGITGVFAGGQAVFAWKPGFFGLTLGVRADAALSAADGYVSPSAGLRLGWLALEGGATFKVADGSAPADYTETRVEGTAPFFRAGLSIPIGPVALDLGARFMATDSYTKIEIEDIGDAVAAPFVAAIIAVLGFIKVDAGLSYVVRF